MKSLCKLGLVALVMAFAAPVARAQTVVVNPEEFFLTRDYLVWDDWKAVAREYFPHWPAYKAAFALANKMPDSEAAFRTMQPGIYRRPLAEPVVATEVLVPMSVGLAEVRQAVREELAEAGPLASPAPTLDESALAARLAPAVAEELAAVLERELTTKVDAVVSQNKEANTALAAELAALKTQMAAQTSATEKLVVFGEKQDDGWWLWWPWVIILLLLIVLVVVWQRTRKESGEDEKLLIAERDQAMKERDMARAETERWQREVEDKRETLNDFSRQLEDSERSLAEAVALASARQAVIDESLYRASDGVLYARVPGQKDKVFSVGTGDNPRLESINKLEKRIRKAQQEAERQVAEKSLAGSLAE